MKEDASTLATREPPAPSQATGAPGASGPEPLLTLRQIADALQVPLFAIRRAAKNGVFATYCVGNKRRRARLAAIASF